MRPFLRTLMTHVVLRVRAARRSRRIGAVASVLASILLGASLVALPAQSASATNQSFAVDCTGLSISFEFFPEGEPAPNRLTIEVNGEVKQGTAFGASLTAAESFANPAQSNTYRVTVVAAWDEPGPDGNGPKGWSRVYAGTAPACSAPAIQVSAGACTVPGGQIPLTASVSGLDPARQYNLVLAGPDGALDTRTIGGIAGDEFDLGDRPAGVDYTVTVTDVAAPSIVSRELVAAASCGKVGGVSAEVVQCEAPGAQGEIVFTDAALQPGSTYEVRSGFPDGPAVGRFVFAAPTDRYSVRLDAGRNYTLFLVDQQGAVLVLGPIAVELAACPSAPITVSAAPAACKEGSASPVRVELGDLVIGRAYQLLWDGVPSGETFIASSATATVPVTAARPGSYTVRVVDVADPLSFASAEVTVPQCAKAPEDPALAALVATCSPGSATSTIQATASALPTGRTWDVQLLMADEKGGYALVADRPGLATVDSAALRFADVQNGASYRIALVSDGTPRLSAQTQISAPRCQVSAAEFTANDQGDPPASVSALARTGTDAVAPAIGALALLLLGAALTVVAALRRRKEAES